MKMDGLFSGRRFPLAIFAIWLICSAAMLVLSYGLIAILDFRDADDALRLVQIRDWMAGQSWFDVTQYRINPPEGGPMHWSRLIDLPIAALLWFTSSFLNQIDSERAVLAVYPLLVMGLLFGIFACAVRRLAGAALAVLAVVLLGLTMPVLIQLMPMRIDHHGWQIVMAAWAFYASLLPSPRKSGILTGLAVAFWLIISSEALPYAALFGALYALKYLRHPDQWDRLAAYLWTVTLGAAALLLVTRGLSVSLRFYCDTMSPTFLIPMGTAALLILGLKALLPDHHPTNRVAIIAVPGAGALIALSLTGRECMAGPFETLDPLVYRFWYLKVSEGLPIWDQQAATIFMTLVAPILGAVGYALAIRAQKDAAKRARWIESLFVAAGAFTLSLLVMRAMSIAHLFMLPGNAWLFLTGMSRARTLYRTSTRIIASVATVLLIPALPTALLANAFSRETATAHGSEKAQCTTPSGLRYLAALPPATLFAPLDIGPYLLVHTHHRVIATAHHRNHHAMATVITAFMSAEPEARETVMGTGADYLVYCPQKSEIGQYVKHAPTGLAARLEAGQVPTWLQPVPMRQDQAIRVYRIVN
ncbi:hypothetical protein [Rhizorhapis sp. SPR117]|uniref:hypothetical protein n=1 Tax=Rhizorhapis sp. SPR117 TaxID=2912611 RepID=UPI001F1752AE|nr:hypothetical protein [Rhizorhapis sp. SPR117]